MGDSSICVGGVTLAKGKCLFSELLMFECLLWLWLYHCKVINVGQGVQYEIYIEFETKNHQLVILQNKKIHYDKWDINESG